MLLDAPSNKSSVAFFSELTTPGGTFTFRSTTVALSNGASRPQLSSAAQAISVAVHTHTRVFVCTLRVCVVCGVRTRCSVMHVTY